MKKLVLSVLLTLLGTVSSASMKVATDKTFYKDVTNSKGLVLVDFSEDGCVWCERLHPILDKLQSRYKSVKFYQVNLEESYDTCDYFKVRAFPTLIMFKDGGSPVVVQEGYDDEAGTKANIDAAIKRERR
jgi:thioredoxin 1